MERLFRKMNVEEGEAAFRGMLVQLCEPNKQEREACAVAIDGKAQKGRLKFEEEKSYPIHAVSSVEHKTGRVLTQGHVERAETETKSRQPDKNTQSEQPDKNMGKKTKPKGNKGE